MTKKLSLMGLILIVFTSVFGFGNIPTAFYLMGYSAIPWYVLSAILFFIPYAFIMSEYGAAFKNEQGGIYSWMEKSVGPKFAFVGAFMWFSSYVIWMVSVAAKVFIPLSTAISGTDQTQTWSLFGLNSTQTIGLLAIGWMVIVTFFASKGMEKIGKITSIGGIAVMCLNLVLLLASVAILILNNGELATPVEGIKSFVTSPNSAYSSPISILSFVVFAIFAYGGIEAVGGLVDKTDKAERNFPKGIAISALVISIGYSLGIFLAGVSANWAMDLGADTTNLGNITYVLMQNLGYKLGLAMDLGVDTAATVGIWFARITGLSMFFAYTGAFFTLIYAPLKTIIQGTPKKLWPKSWTKLSKDGMPVNAMWVQFAVVSIIIFFVSFGGSAAKEFFMKITLMTNVAMTLPVLFLAIAFPKFKRNQAIAKPFEVYKSYKSALIASIAVVFIVGFANLFTIIEPWITKGDYSSTLFMIAGPVIFSVIALLIYKRSERAEAKEEKKAA